MNPQLMQILTMLSQNPQFADLFNGGGQGGGGSTGPLFGGPVGRGTPMPLGSTGGVSRNFDPTRNPVLRPAGGGITGGGGNPMLREGPVGGGGPLYEHPQPGPGPARSPWQGMERPGYGAPVPNQFERPGQGPQAINRPFPTKPPGGAIDRPFAPRPGMPARPRPMGQGSEGVVRPRPAGGSWTQARL